MIIDVNDLEDGTELAADIIIIGGGMAGITLARELVQSSKKVMILESGGRELDMEVQGLYAGKGTLAVGDGPGRDISDYVFKSRGRLYGGSGHWWGGKCVPLDEADMAPRPWLNQKGWPMTREQLQPYYDRACDVLSIDRFNKDYTKPQHQGRPPLDINGSVHITSLPRAHTLVTGRTETDHFTDFIHGFADAPNMSVYLHANVVDFQLSADGTKVESLAIATLKGNNYCARAEIYVLACGGIENARLLLAANVRNKARFGARSGALGRYFQGHATLGVERDGNVSGTQVNFTNPQSSLSLYVDRDLDSPHAVLGTTMDGQHHYKSPAFTVTIGIDDEPPYPAEQVLRMTAKRIAQANVAAKNDSECWCYFMTENLPNPDSRIKLSNEVDALGVPQVVLDWKYSETDIDGYERSLNAFVREMGLSGIGRVCAPIKREDMLELLDPSRHHMGATRMDADPSLGVVDTNLKSHDADNLYIAGSSVFPTSGIANPTLTILALTLRLSDHLKLRMGI